MVPRRSNTAAQEVLRWRLSMGGLGKTLAALRVRANYAGMSKQRAGSEGQRNTPTTWRCGGELRQYGGG
uniref:Uncharacterized protein n=1 Tax=Arundo donax TaxID=35708 RepID=A0A0A9A0T9_ARUDO